MLLKVRKLRLQRGLSLSEVAASVGIASQALSAVEAGRQLAWPALRRRLVQFYGVGEDELFHDVDRAQRLLRELAGERES